MFQADAPAGNTTARTPGNEVEFEPIGERTEYDPSLVEKTIALKLMFGPLPPSIQLPGHKKFVAELPRTFFKTVF